MPDTYRFSPPTVPLGTRFRSYADSQTRNLFSHFREPNKGISIALIGDTFHELEYVYGDDVAGFDRFYQGGRVYDITAQEASDLTDAGYTVERISGLIPRATFLLRASEFTGVTGDPWPNEGTGGPDLDALCNAYIDGEYAGLPVFSETPIPGFQIANDPVTQGPFYYIPHTPLLEPGVESFTVFAWVTWQQTSSGFANICSMIDTPPAIGSGGTGWQLVDSPFTNGTTFLVSGGGLTAEIPVGLNLASSGSVMTVDTHLVVGRVDLVSGVMNVFVDGTKSANADCSQLGPITADHELILGRGSDPQIGHAYGFFPEALTDDEITDDLNFLLGI